MKLRDFSKLLILLLISALFACSPVAGKAPSRQDTLRGSNGSGRNWWDVVHYDLQVSFDTAKHSIYGAVTIRFRVVNTPQDSIQIDLQTPMFLDSVVAGGSEFQTVKEDNVWWILHSFHDLSVGDHGAVTIYYHGRPHEARNPPWDGGLVWRHDSLGRLWGAVACQGFGASSWWPCKDYQGDEPDSGMLLTFKAPPGLTMLSNGRLVIANAEDSSLGNNVMRVYQVLNPINSYDATFYLGHYSGWSDTLQGSKGILDLNFYPLDYNLAKARQHWASAKDMLRCFEYWLGPYPFYADGYKLVEAPYLGMEHQSAVAYGNQYKMGYLGHDRSGTGIGLGFDFILIHESAHEWFGNSITARDVADNWIHEGFTTYCEALYAEWKFGKTQGIRYHMGQRKNILNQQPIIGIYGVQQEGSDIYDKGAAVVHMIRLMLKDDEKFRQVLRGMNTRFYHQIVSSAEVENFLEAAVGKDLKPFFNQYLRSTSIPKVTARISGKKRKKILEIRIDAQAPGFELPLLLRNGRQLWVGSKEQSIRYDDLAPDWDKNLEQYLVNWR